MNRLPMLRSAIIIFSAIVLFLLAGALPIFSKAPSIIFSNPLFLVLVCVLALMICICCLRVDFSMRRIGFYAVHIGTVIIIAGALLGYFRMQNSEFAVPCNSEGSFSELLLDNGNSIKLGFSCKVSDFHVKFYPEAQIPERFDAKIQFSIDGKVSNEQLLMVNHPAYFKGWRFYLMDYDQGSQYHVVLFAKKDPGRMTAIAGIWILLFGAFVLCFRKNHLPPDGGVI
ncbi:MAG TPA: hypothetical protein DCZ94_00745 [Lentisphaeria bacterium]|nr:MAG: hypothetical protein A2X48_12310 [Lentisphaerae bacterium GWF2_49_21]HBC85459.1 hypothetical protein [Lentisphaeria bacterium]